MTMTKQYFVDATADNISQVPTTLPNTNVVDSLLAREMNEMSVNERELAYYDIHGVSQTGGINQEENNNNNNELIINQFIYEFQQSISKIKQKPAYDIAMSQSPEFVGGKKIILKFLQSTNFDVKWAATKCVNYFEYKRFYFGDSQLGSTIRYDDLNSDDLECLRSGWIQVLPFRDKAGRAVLWFDMTSLPKKNITAIIRAMWYFITLVSMDIETQKSGIVIVATRQGGVIDTPSQSKSFAWHAAHLPNYIPLRILSCHSCMESLVFAPLVSLALLGWDKMTRIRSRIHCGTQTEWMYKLMTFGIPIHWAPLTVNGNLKTKSYRTWLTHKHVSEVTSTMSNEEKKSASIGMNYNIMTTTTTSTNFYYSIVIDLPRQNDILLGKGKVQQSHAGNLLFLQIIQDYIKQYEISKSRSERLQVIQNVWNTLQKENARFLDRNYNNDQWILVIRQDIIISRIQYQLRTKKAVAVTKKSSSSSSNSIKNSKRQKCEKIENDNNKKCKNNMKSDNNNNNMEIENNNKCKNNNYGPTTEKGISLFLNQTGQEKIMSVGECCSPQVLKNK